MTLPSLPDDVISEILLRLPHDDPSSLLRATLVCKLWLRIASDPHFLRRLRGLNPAPAILGFFRGPRAPCFTAVTAAAFSTAATAAPSSSTWRRRFICSSGRQ
uniref:F-box domain-containing protein n=1 Tax=Arundo donax TaxID=35708 RepID=A0A0A9GSW0_ARUDO